MNLVDNSELYLDNSELYEGALSDLRKEYKVVPNYIEWVNDNTLIVARTGPGSVHVVGRVVAYCDAPQLIIEDANGKQTHWRADMCKAVDLPDDVAETLRPKLQGAA